MMNFPAAPDFTSLIELLRFYGDADEIVFKSHSRLGEPAIAEACREGRRLANHLRMRDGSQNADEIAVSHGFAVAREAWRVADGKIIYLGECSLRPPVIRINTEATGSLAGLTSHLAGENNWEFFTEAKITEAAVAHELFHMIARRAPSTAVELQAHAFARAFTELPFSPLLYEALLKKLASGKTKLL